MLSIIIRYKNEAGTPDRVRNGGKNHFLVRRVLAYILGDPNLISQIDAKAKGLSAKHMSEYIERPGKTEFRVYSSKDECLSIFAMLAEQHGLSISRPQFDTIAWDYLIGAGSISPRDWIVNKYNDFKKQQKKGALKTEERVPVLHIPSETISPVESIVSAFTV